MGMAGHVSRQMLMRYSHVRSQAKQAAIATLERADFGGQSPQNPPQSDAAFDERRFVILEKSLN
jgi:hypothetical protein